MRTVALSGWGQPVDALSVIAPDALHVDYAKCTHAGDALEALALAGRGCDMAIGWSLGGQLLARAVSAGVLDVKRLVLIAAPFQYIAGDDFPHGMGRETFQKFRANVERNPERALKKGWELIAHGDANADTVRGYMAEHNVRNVLDRPWLGWLSILEDFSCRGLHFAAFPPTLLVHGKNDAVSNPAQSRAFAERIPNLRLALWEGCGHAPHWHDAQRLKRLIGEF